MFKKRVVAKTIIYKTLTLLTTLLVFSLVAGEVSPMTGVASVVLVGVNTLLYAVHEALWGKTEWGR